MRGPHLREKWLAVPFILLSNDLAIALLYLTCNGWRGSPELASWVANNRTAVGIVVQILSHAIGLATVQALCTILNLSTRAKLAANGLSLDYLKLSEVLRSMRVDWSINYKHLSLVLLWNAAAIIPGALWAGAITPVTASVQHTQNLTVASFDNNFGIGIGKYSQAGPRDNSLWKATELGTSSFAPDLDLQGLILNAAQDASDRDGGSNVHRKLDKTGYIYTGRSYGVATTVGLREDFEPKASSYDFRETGLLAESECIRNLTSEYRLEAFPVQEGWTLHVYNAIGTFPNGDHSVFAAAALADFDAFAMGTSRIRGYNNYVAFATMEGVEGRYALFHGIQCAVRFTPTTFNVHVNTTAKLIEVVPESAALPFTNSVNMATRVMHIIGTFGSMLSTTLWISVLGEVFKSNIANVEVSNGTNDASIFAAVSMSLDSIMDSSLEAISAAQIEVLNETQTVSAITNPTALIFGALPYQIAVSSIGLLLALVFAVEAIQTRFWASATSLDFMDLKSVILATSAGGTGIATRANYVTSRSSRRNTCRQDSDFDIIFESGQGGHETLVVKAQASSDLALLHDTNSTGDAHVWIVSSENGV